MENSTFCGCSTIGTSKFCVACGKPKQNYSKKTNLSYTDSKVSNNSKALLSLLSVFALLAIISFLIYFFFKSNTKKEGVNPTEAHNNIDKTKNNSQDLNTESQQLPNNYQNQIENTDKYNGFETGKFPAYIKYIYKKENKYYIDVDFVTLFENDKVEKAMLEDKLNYDETIDEIYVRNKNLQIRTYEIDSKCKVVIQNLDLIKTENDGEHFLKYINKNWGEHVYYISLNNRICTLINQLWLP